MGNKPKIHIFHKPMGLGDQFSDQMESELQRKGLDVKISWLWPPRLYLFCGFGKWAGKFRLNRFHDFVIIFLHYKYLRRINKGDVVVVDGNSTLRPSTQCGFEKKIIRKNASYIFYLIDDLLSIEGYRESTEKRIQMAQAVIVPTPQLKERVEAYCPDKPVFVMEEPIDVHRVGQVSYPKKDTLLAVAWTGRILRAKSLVAVLSEVKQKFQFVMRVVTGRTKPDMGFSFEWDWKPFSRSRESDSFSGCVAGVANLENTMYDACKGNYKMKTYMAMGLCPIVSNVGYAQNLIEHKKTGLLVSTHQEWIEAIQFVVEHPDETIDMGKRARKFMEERYSTTTLSIQWAEVFNELIDELAR